MIWLGVMSLMLSPVMGQDSQQSSEDVITTEDIATPPAEAAQSIVPLTPTPAGSLISIPPGATVAVVPIEGMIYGFTLDSMQRRIDQAINGGATVIVLEIDTNGGRLDAALEISKYIKTISVPTVAWINNKAYSAGILIASACNYIVMSPASATGDCAPINPFDTNLGAAERGKILAPLLTEFRDNARRTDIDYALYHAMCTLNTEVYVVKHRRTGEQRLINQVDFEVMVNNATLDEAEQLTDGVSLDAYDPTNEEELAKVGKASLNVATTNDRGEWEPVLQLPSGENLPNGRLHDGNTILTIDQTIAEDIDLSQATLATVNDVGQFLQANSIDYVNETWSYGFAGWLSKPWVRGILFFVMLAGLYLELSSPGAIIPGVVAVIALILLLGAPFIIGLAEVWHILLFLIGFVLLLVEVFFTPSFGALGLVGAGMMLMGIAMSVVPLGNSSPFGPSPLSSSVVTGQLVQSLAFLLIGVVLFTIFAYVVTKNFARIPVFSRLILQDDPQSYMHQPEGAEMPVVHVSGDEALGHHKLKVGDQGKTITPLRPGGKAVFSTADRTLQNEDIDVVSVGPFIDRDQSVKVVEIGGNRIVVDEA